MQGNEFLLGIFGLSRVERMTVASVCSLTQQRPRGYSVLPVERSEKADIVLVDADDAAATRSFESSTHFRNDRPALMISRNAATLSNARYSVARASFAARLIKILDQITVNEFRFIPDVMIGDDAKVDPALQTGPTRARQFRSGRPKVLVVDDALVVRTQMQALLEVHQVDAVLASDAERAVAMMQLKGPFSMIFLDVVMPGMDGYAACRRLKGIDRNVPIIMLTGKDSAFDKIRGVMAGCNRYLTKPIAVNDLSKVLDEFLEKDFPAPHGVHI